LGPYIRRSTGLLLFNPDPHQLPDGQEPTPTFQSSNGCWTFRSPKSARRFATCSRLLRFGSSSVALPSSPIRHRRLTLDDHRYPCAGLCPCLLSSDCNLSHSRYDSPEFTASADAVEHLTSLDRSSSYQPPIPFEMGTYRTDLGLSIRLMVDGHHLQLRLPTCPRLPTVLLRKLLGSDGASTSHLT